MSLLSLIGVDTINIIRGEAAARASLERRQRRKPAGGNVVKRRRACGERSCVEKSPAINLRAILLINCESIYDLSISIILPSEHGVSISSYFIRPYGWRKCSNVREICDEISAAAIKPSCVCNAKAA